MNGKKKRMIKEVKCEKKKTFHYVINHPLEGVPIKCNKVPKKKFENIAIHALYNVNAYDVC